MHVHECMYKSKHELHWRILWFWTPHSQPRLPQVVTFFSSSFRIFVDRRTQTRPQNTTNQSQHLYERWLHYAPLSLSQILYPRTWNHTQYFMSWYKPKTINVSASVARGSVKLLSSSSFSSYGNSPHSLPQPLWTSVSIWGNRSKCPLWEIVTQQDAAQQSTMFS